MSSPTIFLETEQQMPSRFSERFLSSVFPHTWHMQVGFLGQEQKKSHVNHEPYSLILQADGVQR